MNATVALPRTHQSVPAGSTEHQAGMEVFYTDTPPLGGRLRTLPEDFVVDEVGGRPRDVPNGKHLALRIRLTNWEHNHFIRDAARRLGVGRNAIGFAGTKDKRAVTTQWFSFLTRAKDADAIERLEGLPRVQVLESLRTERGIRLGQHEGNAFQIVIRSLDGDADDLRARLDRTVAQLAAIQGFPNFFGIQRFGAVRPITHLVGRAIVNGDIEEAVMTYVTGAAEEEGTDAAEARAIIRENRDWKEAQRILPEELKFERAIVQHLSRDPTDFVGALRSLPTNLVLLFLHAYQSYLFNRMLSERIRQGLPLHLPVEGDIILPMAGGQIIETIAPIPVTAANLEKIARQAAKGRAAVSLPLYGFDTPLADGTPGRIERQVLAEENVTPDAFRVRDLPEATSKGLRRALLAPVSGLEAEVRDGADGPTAHLRFSLPKGSYATTFLREVLKSPDATLY